jgi:hypothetical protein
MNSFVRYAGVAILSLLTPLRSVYGEVVPLISVDSATINLPFDKKVGSVRAGTLCFPKSSIRVSQFVESSRDFRRAIQEHLNVASDVEASRRPASGPMLSFSLTDIEAKLCAKDWGVFGSGDTKALSGHVVFHFGWAMRDGAESNPETVEIVDVAVSPAEAVPPKLIFDQAVGILIDRIRDAQATKR